jgi:TP901 family phage tail tape measure protein
MAQVSERLAVIVDAKTGAAVAEINKVGNAATKANRDLKSLGDRGIDSGKRIDGAMSHTRDALKGIGLVAAGVAVVGGAALVKFSKSVLDIGTQFQGSLNTLQAVTHSTDATMQLVGKRARDLGNDLELPATSAADAANAMTQLAKGNLTAQQAMDAAKGTLLLAAAAQVDGATAAQIQANALNAFSLKASQAGHVSDVLANAANSATGEIKDFALGLQASSAVAAQFGISLDDTVTALALFANKGIKGSDAGTSLKASLLALASPSLQAKKALTALHLSAFDAQGKFVGLASISEQLATAQKHLSQEAFAAAVSTAFGSDAARAAGVLASAGAAGFEKMGASVSRAGGAALVAQAQMKGVGGAIQGLQSQIETVKIDIFTREAPHLESFIRALSSRLPDAADAALRGLDRLTSSVETNVPRAQAEFRKFAPVIDTYFSGKVQLAGQAVDNVLSPALRGLETIVTRLAPDISKAGDAIDRTFSAGIDAAGKAAHSFELSAGDTATAVSAAGESIGKVGHDVLPVFTGGLRAAGAAAGVLVSAVSGAATILSPFAGSALGAVAAIKGIQLASSGVGKVGVGVDKVTTAWGKLSAKVVNAAGLIQSSVTSALGANLNTTVAATESTMAKTATTMRVLGGAGLIAGAAVAVLGFSMQQERQQAEANVLTFRKLFDQLAEGGQVAINARASLDQYTAGLQAMKSEGGLTADLAGKLSGQLDSARDAASKAAAALTPLDAAQVAVTKSQNDYTLAATSFGRDSEQAISALALYTGALANQKGIQDLVNQATAQGTQTLAEYTIALGSAAEADNARVQQELAVKQGVINLKQAQDAVNVAVSKYGPASAQAAQATLSLKVEQAGLKAQILGAADAAGAAAKANSKAGTEAGKAGAGAAAYRAELGKLVGTLAPGNPLRRELEQLIAKLDQAAKDRTAHINVVTTGVSPLPGPRKMTPQRAAGGPVSKGQPYVVGEHGPEFMVPDSNGYIYPRVPGGASATRAAAGGGSTYNISVSVGTGSHPADVGAGIVKAIREFEKRSGSGWRATA